jgi:hypothetical protein
MRTNVLKILQEQSDLKLVVFSPIVDEGFKKEFRAENVIVEPLPKWKPTVMAKMLWSLRQDIWSEKARTRSYLAKREEKSGAS